MRNEEQVPVNLDPSAVRTEVEAVKGRAMALVERAQHDLEHAFTELDQLLGAWPEQERIGKLAEEAHTVWRRLAYVRPEVPWELKHAYQEDLAKRLAQPEAGGA